MIVARRLAAVAYVAARSARAAGTLSLRPGEALDDSEKTLYVVRHAEGYHNKGERELPNWHSDQLGLTKEYWDARLTPEGVRQSESLNLQLQSARKAPPQLVVVSTLSRTIQTAARAFGGLYGWPNTYVATELCRERIADHECDHRRSKAALAQDFAFVDFSEVEDEEDVLWTARKEVLPDEMNATLCVERGGEFLAWLAARPEKRIAVVSHWVYLKHLFGAYATEHPELAENFKNAELRTVALVGG
eukprot:CAMPEP_0119295688 /NCGR_PEP_ID=MMETSP1329-20130426/50188_1 /TAXON_ID=114041 /ORGANISM="Genus nov. species nov., Strain RCC1024" /LENGTH=246 /DNA_ID=CAMNT_0007296607 /DNA_START=140 /DNA_END=877 /DNA_ORIENTATION=+